MKPLPASASPPLPNDPPAPNGDDADLEPDVATLGQRVATWLRHFTLYLGAVITAGALGLYFLWRLPIPQEAAQLFGSAGDLPRSRPLATVVAPPAKPPLATPVAPGAPVMVAPQAPPPATDPAAIPVDAETPVPAAPLAEPPVEVVSPSPTAEIEQLLAEAQQQMESRRLTAPASGNALRSYQRILELEANHPAALEGIERIAAYYRDIAEQTRQQGRLEESLNSISRGLQASPKNERLLNLRREVRLLRQREQDQRQARTEEARRQQQQVERDEQNQFGQRIIAPPQPWWQQPAPPANDSGFNQR
jgi:hypothetical protein